MKKCHGQPGATCGMNRCDGFGNTDESFIASLPVADNAKNFQRENHFLAGRVAGRFASPFQTPSPSSAAGSSSGM